MDMKKMMKQAQKMQRDAAAAQQEIAAMTFEASAGGGMVKATATGEMAITDITIDPVAVAFTIPPPAEASKVMKIPGLM